MDDSASPSRSTKIHKAHSNDSVKLRSNFERKNSGWTYCQCKSGNGVREKARLWTSWTETNPGRRFYGCPHYEKDGCGFFEWHDEPLTERAKNVINDLKRENRRLHSSILGLEEAIRVRGRYEETSFDETPLLEYDDNSNEHMSQFQIQEVKSSMDADHMELKRGSNKNRNYVIVVLLCVLVVVICMLLC